ncbi:class I SAM-dependent DNA methyltransferase [Phytohabitans suffuscus]|uniref:Methyltransferase n=1 Tax=Phytohabitans suffuscus TaxID=624315 RepID=A0A6F8YVX6_9ACTN|nr:class I SAM-dependent methyltransferase [Phytohabitans suffuscus]BCB90229.1 methyltransferase [Phytohabitans suffuscus]
MVEPPHVAETRTAYDTVAADYADLLKGALAEAPLERALLGAFAELVGDGAVADVGCGPGRITTHLAGLGLDVRGVDLSPRMVAVARRLYPEIPFEVGTMTGLAFPDGALAGLVAWYSAIHTPPKRLPLVFAEFARVLRPGGHLLMAFQAPVEGDDFEPRRIERAYGHALALDAYRLPPDRVADLLAAAGVEVTTRVVRRPESQEKSPQAYLMARR